MINFCTLFNSNYLTRGMALYESLLASCKAFHLYIVAFDDDSFSFLSRSDLKHVTVISMAEFEDEALLSVKPQRTQAEYCWTSTSSLILYCINTYKLPSCTYVDADMFLQVLNWWRDRCIEWCYNRQEDGKFGDQKYLDDWTTRFEGVHVLKHPGAGVAPWNIQQFNIQRQDGVITITNLFTKESSALIFYHFHGLKFYTDNIVSYTGTLYDITDEQKALIYQPYVLRLVTLAAQLRNAGIKFNVDGARSPSPTRRQTFIDFLKEKSIVALKGNLNSLTLKSFNFTRHYHFEKTPILK
jgi:hypothetical protein